MAMGGPYRWPWLHSILTSPGRSKSLILPESSPSLLALHAAPRKGFLISNPLAFSEGPRPGHHHLPRSKNRPALIPGPPASLLWAFPISKLIFPWLPAWVLPGYLA